jgi:acetate kinase
MDTILVVNAGSPLHQPNNLAPVRALLTRMPGLPQVACFDTSFHRGHSALADHYAIPVQLHAEGVRRYGFHGLSYEYVAGRLPEVAPEIAAGRVIVAHLGSGASMCALSGGRSIESTMGFTALDGLPMGTRPGQIDPGVVLYLINQKQMSADQVQVLLYEDCGLKGLSGISNDVSSKRALIRRHNLRSITSPTASGSMPGCSRPRSAASTASFSPPASARTRRACGHALRNG